MNVLLCALCVLCGEPAPRPRRWDPEVPEHLGRVGGRKPGL